MKKRLERITKIVDLLQSDRSMTASEIAAKLNVHRRTIFRDFVVLRDLGTGIEFDARSGRYSYQAQANVLSPSKQYLDHALDANKDSMNKSCDESQQPPCDNQKPCTSLTSNQMAQQVIIVIGQHGWLRLRLRTDADHKYQTAIPWELTLDHGGWKLCFTFVTDDLLGQWNHLDTPSQRDRFRKRISNTSVVTPLQSLSILPPDFTESQQET